MSSDNTGSWDLPSEGEEDMMPEECNTSRREQGLRRPDTVRPYEGGEYSKANARQVKGVYFATVRSRAIDSHGSLAFLRGRHPQDIPFS